MADGSPGALIDTQCPVDWQNPLNRGLGGRWQVMPNPGWRGGVTLRDLVRGGKKPNDGTLTSMTFPPTSTSGWSGPKGRPGGYGSLSFDGTDDSVVTPEVEVTSASQITFAAWVYPSSVSAFRTVVAKRSGSSASLYLRIGSGSGDAALAFGYTFNAGTFTTTPGDGPVISAGRWTHVGVTFNYATAALAYYRDGVRYASTLTGNTSPDDPNVGLTFGNRADNAHQFAGQMDDFRFYPSRVLSAGEMAAFYGDSRKGSPDTLRWLSTRAWFVPQAGGTSTPLSLSGSVTLSGALPRSAGKALSGSAALSGAVARSDAKALTGSLAASGSLGKAAGKALSGSASSSGSLSRETDKAFAGSASPAGSLARGIGKVVAGTLTLAGALLRSAGKALSGSVAPAGTLSRDAGKTLSGSAAASGALAKSASKPLSGLVSPSGDLSFTRLIALLLSGSVSLAGSLVRSAAKAMSGSVSPGGSLAKTIGKAWAGAVSLSGSLAVLGGSAGAAAAYYFRRYILSRRG